MNYSAMLNKQRSADSKKAKKRNSRENSINSQIEAISELLNDVSRGKKVDSDDRLVVFGRNYKLKSFSD